MNVVGLAQQLSQAILDSPFKQPREYLDGQVVQVRSKYHDIFACSVTNVSFNGMHGAEHRKSTQESVTGFLVLPV